MTGPSLDKGGGWHQRQGQSKDVVKHRRLLQHYIELDSIWSSIPGPEVYNTERRKGRCYLTEDSLLHPWNFASCYQPMEFASAGSFRSVQTLPWEERKQRQHLKLTLSHYLLKDHIINFQSGLNRCTISRNHYKNFHPKYQDRTIVRTVTAMTSNAS